MPLSTLEIIEAVDNNSSGRSTPVQWCEWEYDFRTWCDNRDDVICYKCNADLTILYVCIPYSTKYVHIHAQTNGPIYAQFIYNAGSILRTFHNIEDLKRYIIYWARV